MRLLEIFELQRQQGPCLDCYRAGKVVDESDLASATRRWPAFAIEAHAAGFASATAVPLRLRQVLIGVMNLFRVRPGPMDPADLLACQALADVATIGRFSTAQGRRRGC
jgi:GAF domain-containing protein